MRCNMMVVCVMLRVIAVVLMSIFASIGGYHASAEGDGQNGNLSGPTEVKLQQSIISADDCERLHDKKKQRPEELTQKDQRRLIICGSEEPPLTPR